MSGDKGDAADLIWDSVNRKSYVKGALLGKGAFGRCYEVADPDNDKKYAGKIISKALITQKQCKDKVVQEILIHKSLKHPHIVEFCGYFDDVNNIYILLELCLQTNMEELLKQRRRLTTPEVKYYMIQVLKALQYLHDKCIIHRDLKLGNTFINEKMEVKIGDFGLAAKLQHPGERKLTICGTPNYIAPEILEKVGHGFEVDVWSLGCIIYTLLEGSPPFSGEDIGETYMRIRTCCYSIPVCMNPKAASILRRIFVRDPKFRPNVTELMNDAYFTTGFIPQSLPLSSLISTPQFDANPPTSRSPLMSLNRQFESRAKQIFNAKSVEFFKTWKNRILICLNNKPKELIGSDMKNEDSTIQPESWIHAWLDYSAKYGLGYRLNDGSIGILFRDNSSLTVDLSKNIYYWDSNKVLKKYSLSSYPAKLYKKIQLYELFKKNMNDVIEIKPEEQISKVDCHDHPPRVTNWIRYRSSIAMLISNETFQINCFSDRSKVILCARLEAVTVMDEKGRKTYKFDLIEKQGCTEYLENKLWDLYKKICSMIDHKARTIVKTQQFS